MPVAFVATCVPRKETALQRSRALQWPSEGPYMTPRGPTARQAARGQGAPRLEALQATSCPTASTRAKTHTRYVTRLVRVSALAVCQRPILTRTRSIAQVRTWFKTNRIVEQHRILGHHVVNKPTRSPIYCYGERLSHKHDKIHTNNQAMFEHKQTEPSSNTKHNNGHTKPHARSITPDKTTSSN